MNDIDHIRDDAENLGQPAAVQPPFTRQSDIVIGGYEEDEESAEPDRVVNGAGTLATSGAAEIGDGMSEEADDEPATASGDQDSGEPETAPPAGGTPPVVPPIGTPPLGSPAEDPGEGDETPDDVTSRIPKQRDPSDAPIEPTAIPGQRTSGPGESPAFTEIDDTTDTRTLIDEGEGGHEPETPEPILAPGGSIHIKNGEIEEGPDPDYFNPEAPQEMHVSTDRAAVARGDLEEGNPVLTADIEGDDRAVTLETSTGEAAMVVISGADEGSTGDLDQVLDAIPGFSTGDTQVTIYGEVDNSELGADGAEAWNRAIRDALEERGIPVNDDDIITTAPGQIRVETRQEGAGDEATSVAREGVHEATLASRKIIVDHGPLTEEEREAMRRESLRQAVGHTTPSGLRRINTEGRIDTLVLGYRVATLPRSVSESPAARAAILGKHLSRGIRGAEELAVMIEKQHPILTELRTKNGGEEYIRQLYRNKLSGAVTEYNTRIARTGTDDEGQAIRQGLERARDQLSEALAWLDPQF